MNASHSMNMPNHGPDAPGHANPPTTRRVSARTIGLLAAAAATGSLAFAAAASASDSRPDDRSTGRLQTSVVEQPDNRGTTDADTVDIVIGTNSGGSFDDAFDCPACGMG